MTAMTLAHWMLPAFLAISGIVLLIWAHCGRRRGDAPFCPKCDYNLTGLPAKRCPECGFEFSGILVHRGRRPKRSLAVILGMTLMGISGAVGGSLLVRWVKSWDYSEYPTWWLLWEAQRTDRSTGNQITAALSRPVMAYEELSSRQLAGALSAEQDRKLIQIALNEVLAWSDLYRSGGPTEEAAHQILKNRFELLNPVQRQQYYEHCTWVIWEARPRANLSDGIPIELGIAHLNKIDIHVSLESIKVTPPAGPPESFPPIVLGSKRGSEYFMPGSPLDLPAPFGRGDSTFFGVIMSGPPCAIREWANYWKWTFRPTMAGTWQFECVVKLELLDDYELYRYEGRKEPPPCTIRRVLNTKSTVTSGDGPEMFKLLEDPALESEVQRRIGASFEVSRDDPTALDAEVSVTDFPFPVNVAFEVHFEVEGTRYGGESFAIRKDRPPSVWMLPGEMRTGEQSASNRYTRIRRVNPKTRSAALILTPNPELARNTVDLFEIWGKPIRKEVELPPFEESTKPAEIAPE